MILVDDLLLAPFKCIHWLAVQLAKSVEAELESEADSIVAQLSELYMMLETGRMTEAAFDAEEKVLLDRLEQLRPDDSISEEDEE